MKLSIIIALYNTEKFIKQCLNSIYDRGEMSIDEFEVIVINDGSTDDSPHIVKTFQEKCSNIILVNKNNGGQSSARNVGFNIAKGDYLFCLDSDDFVDAVELNQALTYCYQKDLDILPIYLKKFDEQYKLLPERLDNYKLENQIIDGGKFMNENVIYGSMCRYFYRREIMINYNLKLTEGIFHEDEEFVTKFISYSNRVSYKKHLVYNQVVRTDSTMTNKNIQHRVRLLNDLITVIKNLKLHRELFNPDSLQYIGVSKKIEQLLISLFLRMKRDRINAKDRIEIIERLKVSGLFPLQVEYSSLKFKLISKLFNNSAFNKLYY